VRFSECSAPVVQHDLAAHSHLSLPLSVSLITQTTRSVAVIITALVRFKRRGDSYQHSLLPPQLTHKGACARLHLQLARYGKGLLRFRSLLLCAQYKLYVAQSNNFPWEVKA